MVVKKSITYTMRVEHPYNFTNNGGPLITEKKTKEMILFLKKKCKYNICRQEIMYLLNALTLMK